MKKAIVVLMLLFSFCTCIQVFGASESAGTAPSEGAPGGTITVTDMTGTKVYQMSPKAKKESFAVRHPKLHKAGRKIRRTCTVLLPVVEFAGACAQVASYVRVL